MRCRPGHAGAILLGFSLGCVPFGVRAQAQTPANLEHFCWDRVEALVKAYYPKATVSRTAGTFRFSHDTMPFMIHVPLKTGAWQPARETEGPKRHGGILGELEVRQGRWQGAADVPQTFDRAYFTAYLMAPYSERCDCHLVANLSYPDTIDKTFVGAWTDAVNEFETYLDE